MFKRHRRRVPVLNTTSTADISFMLLILFLVTSSMDTDKGLVRQMPPPPDENEELVRDVKDRNVMTVKLDAADQLTCDGEAVTLPQLQKKVEQFVENADNNPSMPEKTAAEVQLIGNTFVSDRHIIAIETNRTASYDAYFQLQNTIVAAYATLRQKLALQRFGHGYHDCTSEERMALMSVYPQRISENVTEKGDTP